VLTSRRPQGSQNVPGCLPGHLVVSLLDRGSQALQSSCSRGESSWTCSSWSSSATCTVGAGSSMPGPQRLNVGVLTHGCSPLLNRDSSPIGSPGHRQDGGEMSPSSRLPPAVVLHVAIHAPVPSVIVTLPPAHDRSATRRRRSGFQACPRFLREIARRIAAAPFDRRWAACRRPGAAQAALGVAGLTAASPGRAAPSLLAAPPPGSSAAWTGKARQGVRPRSGLRASPPLEPSLLGLQVCHRLTLARGRARKCPSHIYLHPAVSELPPESGRRGVPFACVSEPDRHASPPSSSCCIPPICEGVRRVRRASHFARESDADVGGAAVISAPRTSSILWPPFDLGLAVAGRPPRCHKGRRADLDVVRGPIGLRVDRGVGAAGGGSSVGFSYRAPSSVARLPGKLKLRLPGCPSIEVGNHLGQARDLPGKLKTTRQGTLPTLPEFLGKVVRCHSLAFLGPLVWAIRPVDSRLAMPWNVRGGDAGSGGPLLSSELLSWPCRWSRSTRRSRL